MLPGLSLPKGMAGFMMLQGIVSARSRRGGAVRTAARQSSSIYPHTYYRRRIADPSIMLKISLMAAAAALSEALAEAI